MGNAAYDAKVKGVAFRSVMIVATEILGEEGFEKVMASLGEEDREMLRYKVLHTGWYSIALYRALLRAIAEGTGQGEELIRRVGAGAIRRDVTGVYRMIFKVFSPETVFSLVTRLFNQYYDTGHAEVEGQPGSAVVRYDACYGFDRWMWTELLGTGEELLTIAGAKNARLSILRGGGDSPVCEMEATWD